MGLGSTVTGSGVLVGAPLYTRLWFNDGFHAAHHRFPAAHWTTLPARAAPDDAVSSLPPILRMLEELRALANAAAAAIIDALERGTLQISAVRRYLLETHARSWRQLLSPADVAAIREVTIIGGGLYPRTALVLARLTRASRSWMPCPRTLTARARFSSRSRAPRLRACVCGSVSSTPPRGLPTPTFSLFRSPFAVGGRASMPLRRLRAWPCTTGSGARAATAAWSSRSSS